MKKILTAVGGILMASTLALFAGCAQGTQLDYDDQIHPELGNAYVRELFYRNDLKISAPDPCVIRITDEQSSEYGYYYLYGTTDPDTGFRAYRSKDVTGDWEDVTSRNNFLAFRPEAGHYAYEHGNFWAPEVIWDEESGLYYLFYSGAAEEYGSGTNKTGHRMIGVAVAEEPYGPFRPATTHGLNAARPLFDNDTMVEWCKQNGEQVGRYTEVGGTTHELFNCIDPHPYVAPDGTKYLYFCHEHAFGNTSSDVWGVKMNDWTSPDLSTLTVLTRAGYDTASRDNVPDYERGNLTNEAPWVWQRRTEDGGWRYYLMLSVNGYQDKSYSVVQAVGDSPLGPFRKLQASEGGILLGTDNQRFDHVSGTGHCSFIEAGNELFIVYHEHKARETGGSGERDVAVDRLVWTKNGAGLDVLYCNGPTWSLQPRAADASEYANIAPQAEVKASAGSYPEALTDGMFSVYSDISYVREYETERDATITLSFGDYREIAAVMIYNSKLFEHSFVEIPRIELDYSYEGKTGTAVIEHLAFDWNFYKMDAIAAMRPGGSAVAVFSPLMIKEIRIKVEVPDERPEDIALMDEEGYYIAQEKTAVAEIVVLGK